MSLAILGQSNAANLWAISGINTLSSSLNSQAGKTVYIVQGAVGGSALPKEAAQSSFPHLHWGDKYDSSSPLYAFLQNDFSKLEAVWWVQGEQDAQAGVTTEAYLGRLVELQAIIAAAAGKRPKNLPFIVSPLGNATRVYTNGYKVRDAHLAALDYPGFVRGPEYIDLAVEPDNIHLTSTSRDTFATRAAGIIAPLLKNTGITDNVYSGSFTRDSTTASGTTTYTPGGFSFTPTSIDFSAALGGIYTSTGTDVGSGTRTCSYHSDSGTATHSGDSIYTYSTTDAIGVAGKISSFGAGSFTVDWTKISTPGGTLTVNYTVKAP